MKNALFAMVTSGMMAVGLAGCGGSDSGSDPMSQVCDKLESCQTLSTTLPGLTTAAECKSMGSAALSEAPKDTKSQIDQMLNTCLKQTECAAFTACMKPLVAMMP